MDNFSLIKTLIIKACNNPSDYGYNDIFAFYKRLIAFIDDLYLKEVLNFSMYKVICNKCFEILIIPFVKKLL